MRMQVLLISTVVATSAIAPVYARENDVQARLASLPVSTLFDNGSQALRKGDSLAAATSFAEVVSRHPQDATAQTLLALSYHMSADSRPEAMDMALAGYDLAVRAEKGQYWPSALAGRAAFDRGRYGEALSHFSRALLLRPSDVKLVSAVATSAYMSGDLGLARVAAERAVALSKQSDVSILKVAALANAASGDQEAAQRHLATLTSLSPQEGDVVRARVDDLLKTAPLDAPLSEGNVQAIGPIPVSDQVSVDVAIILSQNTMRARTGLNLLDGLRLQYGGTSNVSVNSDRDGETSYQRVITESITVPQLNYNLNVFSRGGQTYSVVARPQLTAYKGEQSEFFIGRTLKVAVGGINSGSLEQIDIGIEMKVTPIEITATGTKVRIETGRSFLTSDPAGTFSEALTTFRQKVVATAEIKFGETLLLSGLTESVDDKTNSKALLLGDLPVVGNAFNERNKLQRRDAVLVLVTPSPTTTVQGRPWARPEAVERLTKFWTQVIDPQSDAKVAEAQLAHGRAFTRMSKTDVAPPFYDPSRAVSEVISELLAPQRSR